MLSGVPRKSSKPEFSGRVESRLWGVRVGLQQGPGHRSCLFNRVKSQVGKDLPLKVAGERLWHTPFPQAPPQRSRLAPPESWHFGLQRLIVAQCISLRGLFA